jgi:serine/threonine protein phosphatase PrpC
MLTLVESISLAGDRRKQIDDACGVGAGRAWVIDGATDLHDAPLTGAASDAAWIAHFLSARLYQAGPEDPRALLRAISAEAAQAFNTYLEGRSIERWQSPIASMLMVAEREGALHGADLGDCRCFVLEADGGARILGGHESDDEARAAADAVKRAGGGPLLRDAETLDLLRRKRAEHNQPGAYWVFGLQPECGAHARLWTHTLTQPAHFLLCTDGFSALVDRYRAYDAAGIVRAALDHGLQELGRELRAIERADAGAALHPRFKPSDDATALLLRLT